MWNILWVDKSEILYDLEKDFSKIFLKGFIYFLCWKEILKQKRILEENLTRLESWF